MKGANVDLGLLILRLGLGSVMFAHGSQKLLGWFGGSGIHGFIGWLGSMGIPMPLAWLTILVEFFGGLGILFGLLARLSALAFGIEMVVAVFLVHWKVGFFMNWGSVAGHGEGWEYCLALLTASLALALVGPGRYAIADVESWLGRGQP
jgi:putative oxidoreductase